MSIFDPIVKNVQYVFKHLQPGKKVQHNACRYHTSTSSIGLEAAFHFDHGQQATCIQSVQSGYHIAIKHKHHAPHLNSELLRKILSQRSAIAQQCAWYRVGGALLAFHSVQQMARTHEMRELQLH
jgi:hypothetical protein